MKKYKVSTRVLAVVLCIALLAPYLPEKKAEAAFIEGTQNENLEQVLQPEGTTVDIANPTIRVSQTGPSIPDAVINSSNILEGIGNADVGDTFTLSATRASAGFKSNNLTWSSDNTSAIAMNGNKATVMGPGTATLTWTYKYQKYFTRQVPETVETGTTEEDGSATTETHMVTKYYIENEVQTGTITATIKTRILSTVNRMKAGDSITLVTNVPASQSFSMQLYSGISSPSIEKVEVNGFWGVIITAGNELGKFKVQARGPNFSDPYEIEVVQNFTLDYTNKTINLFTPTFNKTGLMTSKTYNSIVLNAATESSNDVLWYLNYKDALNQSHKIQITNGAVPLPGVNVVIGDNPTSGANTANDQLTLNLDDTFNFNHNTFRDFSITAEQSDVKGTTSYFTCDIRVTNPVTSMDIFDESGDPITEQKEWYVGDGKAINATIFGENNTKPYNSKVIWASSNPAVLKVDSTSNATSSSRCELVAGKAGVAVITATSEDGAIVKTAAFVVRPYPTKVEFEDDEIMEDLNGEEQKKFQLVVNVTSGDPEADEFIDPSIHWKLDDTSLNSNVLEIDDNGKVTVHNPGTAVVIATSAVEYNNFQDRAPFATCTIIVKQPVTNISITNKPTEPILTGTSIRLKYKITPDNATDKSVTWLTSNPRIATVDADGKVTTLRPGTVNIILQSSNSAVRDQCTITVKRVDTGIRLNKSVITVSRGHKVTLIGTVLPEDTTDKTITWTSSDKSVATVRSTGANTASITGMKVSKTPIFITATTATGKTAKCKVIVTEPVTGIKISPTSKTIYVGNTFTIKKTVYPMGKDIDTRVTWTSSNRKAATVNSAGKVTPVAGGRTVITARTVDGGFIAKCSVTVKEKVRKITLNKKSLLLNRGNTYQLRATVLRKTATNRKVKWSSSNKKVVTVSSTGKLKAKKNGKATITCNAKDGSKIKAKCKVQVITPIRKLKLSKYYLTMIRGYRYRLHAKITPKKASVRTIRWSSSNKNVASVTSSGNVRAERAGVCYIKAKTVDGSKLSRICRVRVINPIPATSIQITKSAITIVKGHTNQLYTRVYPTNTTSATRWMSDDVSVAKVSSKGKVTAVGSGTTSIIAYTKDGVESTCTVEVIAMNQNSIAIEQYDKYQLTVDMATTGITWKSSNPLVATVTANGEVMGVKPGVTTISATYKGKKVYCKVRVKKLP